MRNTNEINPESKSIERIKKQVAEKLSGLLIGSADESRKICSVRYTGEAHFPLELLTDEN